MLAGSVGAILKDVDMMDPDERRPQAALDARVQDAREFEDSDDEGDGGDRNHESNKIKAGGIQTVSGGAGPSVTTGAAPGVLAAATATMDVDGADTAASAKPAEDVPSLDAELEVSDTPRGPA